MTHRSLFIDTIARPEGIEQPLVGVIGGDQQLGFSGVDGVDQAVIEGDRYLAAVRQAGFIGEGAGRSYLLGNLIKDIVLPGIGGIEPGFPHLWRHGK